MEFCDKRVAGFAQRRREWLEMHGLLHASGSQATIPTPSKSTHTATWKWWESIWCDCSFVTLVVAAFGLFYWRFPCL
jgi:hypothetical protein